MPQIMIDTSTASIPELREAARFLEACAALRDGSNPNPFPLLPDEVANGLPKPIAPMVPPPPLVVVDSNTQALPAGTVFDSAGMPWDDRIHQSGKGQKKNGEWKLKKGIDLSVVEAVTKELHARKAVTVTSEAAELAEADRRFGQPHYGHGDDDVATPPAPVTLPAAPPPPPPPPALPVSTPAAAAAPVSAAGPTSYRTFLSKVIAATKSGKVTQEEVAAIVAKNGAPSIAMLNSLPHLIPAVENDLDVMLIERA